MKNKNIRAILIDPFAERVSEVTTATGIDSLYNILDCTCITITRINFDNGASPVDMILDDEGLLKDPNNQRFFKVGLFSQLFAGKALLTCSDKQGDTISVHKHMTAKNIEKMIHWYTPSRKELDKSLDWTIIPI